jgi:O-antigen/teichoic acid export membrane protein
VRPLLLIGGIGILALIGKAVLTPIAAMTVNVIAVGSACATGVNSLRKALPEQVRSASPRYEMSTWIAAALPMMLIGGIWQVNGYVSTIAVGTIGGARDAGIYSAVEKGGEFIVLLLVAANMPFAPLVARMRAKGDLAGMQHGAERIAQATAIAAFPIALAFVVFPGVYLGIFGGSFGSGATALRILAVGQLFNAAAGPVGTVLIMTGQERAACWGIGAGLLTTIVLSIALIPSLGVTGAAIADAVSFVVWNLSLNVLCRKRVMVNATALPLLAMKLPRTE